MGCLLSLSVISEEIGPWQTLGEIPHKVDPENPQATDDSAGCNHCPFWSPQFSDHLKFRDNDQVIWLFHDSSVTTLPKLFLKAAASDNNTDCTRTNNSPTTDLGRGMIPAREEPWPCIVRAIALSLAN